MKFGAKLTGQSVHEWRAHNILYNDLKQQIRKVTTGETPSPKQIKRLQDQFEEEFENFSLMVKSKIGEIDYRIARCEEYVSYLATEHDARVKSQFTREISRLTRDLQQLTRFSLAQSIGFRKLIKKYSKWSRGGTALKQFEEKFESSDSAAQINFTPRFLELSMLWDLSRDGRFEPLGSIRGEQPSSDFSAAQDAQFATQHQSLRVWVPSDSVMEVMLTLLPHMHLDGTDQATSTLLDNESFDYVRNGKQPGEVCQSSTCADAWLCAPTGGMRRFTISRLSAKEAKKVAHGQHLGSDSKDTAKKITLDWLDASGAIPFARVISTRTRYSNNTSVGSELCDPSKVWAFIDQDIVASTMDNSASSSFPHAVLQICWTGDTPEFVSDVENSHLVYPVSPSFSLYAFAALTLYSNTFVGRPSWLRTLDEGTDIRRTAKPPAALITERSSRPSSRQSSRPSSRNSTAERRKVRPKRSTSILLNHNAPAPDLEDDEDSYGQEASSPSTLRYWNEFDYPDEDADFAVFIDPEAEDNSGVAEQLSLPIIHLSQKVKRGMNQLRSIFTGESSQETSPQLAPTETDLLLPYSPRLTPQVTHYESFPSVDPRTATRDVVMAMLSCICFALATTVTFLAYSIIMGDDGSASPLGSIKAVLIVGLLFGIAFSGLGAAVYNLQSNPSWLGQVAVQCTFFGLVCFGAGGIAWVSVI